MHIFYNCLLSKYSFLTEIFSIADICILFVRKIVNKSAILFVKLHSLPFYRFDISRFMPCSRPSADKSYIGSIFPSL